MKIDLSTEHATRTSFCPACRHNLDHASGGPKRPEPGDFSVCISCGCILRFDDGMALVRATKADVDGLDTEQLGVIVAIRQAIKERGPID